MSTVKTKAEEERDAALEAIKEHWDNPVIMAQVNKLMAAIKLVDLHGIHERVKQKRRRDRMPIWNGYGVSPFAGPAAGFKRGQLNLLSAGIGSGKTMFSTYMLQEHLKKNPADVHQLRGKSAGSWYLDMV